MACDCGKDDLRPWLIVNPDDDHSRCRDCNEKRRKANEAKAEARKHFNNFRAILARWDKQLAYGKRQGPCQQLAAILKGD
jgi:hypothetical protein